MRNVNDDGYQVLDIRYRDIWVAAATAYIGSNRESYPVTIAENAALTADALVNELICRTK